MAVIISSRAPSVRAQSNKLAGLCVYGGAVVIGLTLVSFPASSAYMKAAHGFTDVQYGAIYLPQLIAAIVGAISGGMLTERLGLRRLYLISLACFAMAQALLAATWVAPPAMALAMVMCATAFFGFGFGFGGGALNAFVVLLFPGAPNAAITALHMAAGAGLTLAPFLFSLLASRDLWLAGPLALLAITCVLFLLSMVTTLPAVQALGHHQADADSEPIRSRFFWMAASIAVLYSVAEGTFSNWAVLYVQEDRGLSASTAALALTAFWASLTVGRLLTSIIALRVKPLAFLRVFPVLMIFAFWSLSNVTTPEQVISGFAIAGLACSGFFPMLVGFSAEAYPTRVAWLASMLTAAMMLGVGIGSYVIGALRKFLPISSLYEYSIVYPVLVLALLAVAARVRPVEIRSQ